MQKYWGRNRGKVYDDLRNGLTHEYLIKRKYFTVYGVDELLSDGDMDNLTINIAGETTLCKCGIIHQPTKNRKGYWHFVNGKYFVDFKRAVNRFISEIEVESSLRLNRNFFARAKQINLGRTVRLTRRCPRVEAKYWPLQENVNQKTESWLLSENLIVGDGNFGYKQSLSSKIEYCASEHR